MTRPAYVRIPEDEGCVHGGGLKSGKRKLTMLVSHWDSIPSREINRVVCIWVMYSEIKRFFERCRRSGLKVAVRNLLVYFNFLNVIRFREPRLKLACDIEHPQLPASTTITHPVGIAIASCVDIGHNVTIYQNVTIGLRAPSEEGCPTICDGATIYTGAVVIGDVRIGEGAVVGANAVVLDDVPDGATVAGLPARKIQKE